jgi:hypothetical protein
MGLSTQQVGKPIIKSKTKGPNLTTREGIFLFLHFFTSILQKYLFRKRICKNTFDAVGGGGDLPSCPTAIGGHALFKNL